MAGWGLTVDGLTYVPCPADTYAPAGTNGRCIACDANRYTATGGPQNAKSDCLVRPGHGLYIDSQPISSLAELGGVAAADAEALECPAGAYGVGGAVDGLCVECPAGSHTLENALAINAAACITGEPG
jgi:hypothetical protein